MNTLEELYTRIFTKDPLEFKDNDPEIEAIVADFRSKRHLYNLGDKKAGSTKAKASNGLKLSIKL